MECLLSYGGGKTQQNWRTINFEILAPMVHPLSIALDQRCLDLPLFFVAKLPCCIGAVVRFRLFQALLSGLLVVAAAFGIVRSNHLVSATAAKVEQWFTLA